MQIEYPFNIDGRGRVAEATGDEHIRQMIEQAIPTGHDAVSAQYFQEDITDGAGEEFIVCSFPKLNMNAKPATSSPPLLLILKRETNSGVATVLASTTLTTAALMHTPCSKSGNAFVDIDHDKIKELVLDTGSGTATADQYGIFRFNSDMKTLSLLKLKSQTGKIGDAMIPAGATAEHALAFSLEDIDADGKLELIERTGTLAPAATVDDLENSNRWNWQIEAFSWNGAMLVFDRNLSEEYVEKNTSNSVQP